MNIRRKLVGAGAAVVASAATLMLGIGPADAVSVIEVDGIQLLNGGMNLEVVVDVGCTPGHTIYVGAGVSQYIPGTATTPPRTARGSSPFATTTCVQGDNDVRVIVTAFSADRPFHSGKAACGVGVQDITNQDYTGPMIEPCTIRLRPVVS